jgi:hypothetical protein
MSKPWEKHPAEKIHHWRWFIVYRDMLPRSIAGAARKCEKSPSTFEKLSRRWDWRGRCEAWDEQIAVQISRQIDEMQSEAIEAMRRRHIQLGLGMQTAAAKELQAWVAKIEKLAQEAKKKAIEEGRDPATAWHDPILTVGELIRLAQEGTAIERLNRGEPTAHTKVETDDNEGLANLSLAETRELKRLKDKMGE